VKDYFGGTVSVEAPLPFLRVGETVTVRTDTEPEPSSGEIQWVSIHVAADGIPRLNIGIALPETQGEAGVSSPAVEAHDPIHTLSFAKYTAEIHHKRKKHQA
jgi:hypothetical protein